MKQNILLKIGALSCIALFFGSQNSFAQTNVTTPTTPGGTANSIPKFNGQYSVVNSLITDNNTSVVLSGNSQPTTPYSGEFFSIRGNTSTFFQRIFNNNNASNAYSGIGATVGIYPTTNSISMLMLSQNYSGSGIFNAPDAGLLYTNGTGGLNVGTYANSQLSFWTSNLKRMTITSGGLVGIGNPSPNYTLDVTGSTHVTNNSIVDGKIGIGMPSPGALLDLNAPTGQFGFQLNIHQGVNWAYAAKIYTDNSLTKAFTIVNSNSTANPSQHDNFSVLTNGATTINYTDASNLSISPFTIRNYTLPVGTNSWDQTVFEVQSDGKTFIGKTRPQSAPYNNGFLTVDGTIVGREVYVVNTGGTWADYVFAKDYKLNNLDEVKNYVDANHHLPNIPSQKEIEENGQGLGKLQVLQMEKIEEVYLYLFEMNKKMELMEQENSILKKKLDELENKKK